MKGIKKFASAEFKNAADFVKWINRIGLQKENIVYIYVVLGEEKPLKLIWQAMT